MKHPWQEISLSDYESHMGLASVQQLQTMSSMMARQLAQPGIRSAMVLGAAGGNGLEHADPKKFRKLYGVDINPDYLAVCKERFPLLEGILECICADLSSPRLSLPHADLLVANLLVEYIGYDCFRRVLRQVQPTFVSCGIQINESDDFVSDSPYLHAFDRLAEVHHQMEPHDLIATISAEGYRLTDTTAHPLPNGKQLLQLDYCRIM